MRLQPAPPYQCLERGVWVAPWMGPNGEMVLLAVTSERKLLVPPATLAMGSDYLAAYDAMWATLEVRDPVSEVQRLAARRRRIRAV